MLDLKILLFLPAFFLCICIAEDISQSNNIFENYVKEIMESDVDAKVVLSTALYHDDGSIKHINGIGFASKTKDSPTSINLGLMKKKAIEDLVSKGNKAGVVVALHHVNKKTGIVTNYDTEERVAIDTGASRVVNNDDGFETGLAEEILNTIYQSNTQVTMNLAEYYADGNIKRSTTATFDPKKVVVKSSKSMTVRQIDLAKKILKRSFKIDTEDRAAIVAELFQQTFKKFKWQVLINPISYKVKSEKMITLFYDLNTFVILGNSK